MKTIQECWAELVAAGLAPDCLEVTAIYLNISGDDFWVITGGNSWQSTKTYYSISSDLIKKSSDKKITLRSSNIDLVKLEWLPYEQDDDEDQEYWVLQGGMIGVSKCEYTNNGKPVTVWGSGNPVLKKTHGDIAPKPENFKEE